MSDPTFDLSYYDPLRARQIWANDPEQLSRELADQFPPKTAIRFMARPFSCDPQLLKRLQIHFEREKLLSRHDFSCFVDYKQLTPDILQFFSRLNFSELMAELPLVNLDTAHWQALFFQCREHGIKLSLFLNAGPQQASLQDLSQVYLFLREQLGYFTLNYKPGYFANTHVNDKFRQLAEVSQEAHKSYLVDEGMNKDFYKATYEFMRLRFGSRVKTLLEINPFAHQTHYQELNRVPYTWDVTLSGLREGHLDSAHLKQLDKTFDAILIFQGFPRLRDPEAVIKELKTYARPTTRWVFVHYNMAALPNLLLLLGNQWQNAVYESSFWPCVKLQSQNSLNQLFAAHDIELQWTPTEVPRPDLTQMARFLDRQLREPLQEDWSQYLKQSHTMIWTAIGEAGLPLQEQEGFAEEETLEGFI